MQANRNGDAPAPPQQPHSDAAEPSDVPMSLVRLRNAFSGAGEGLTDDSKPNDQHTTGHAQASLPPSPVRFGVSPTSLYPPEPRSEKARTPPLYSFEPVVSLTTPTRPDAPAATAAALPLTSHAIPSGITGAMSAEEYFQVAPPSLVADRPSPASSPLSNPQQQTAEVTEMHGHRYVSIPASSPVTAVSPGAKLLAEGEPSGHENPLTQPQDAPEVPSPPPEHHGIHSSGSSGSDDTPRSRPRPLTSEEMQLARLHAWNEMFGGDSSPPDANNLNGSSAVADATSERKKDGSGGFLSDTVNTILPTGFATWISHSADVVAHQSSDAVPENVKRAASAAANTIGAGAQHIGDAITHVPGIVVGAIPTAIMSEDVKRLVFTDFSNTLRSFFHTNILSMPYVLRQAGLVGGIFILTFVAVTSEYATEAYFGAKNQMKNAHKVVLYGDVPRMTWGQWYPMINMFYGVTHLIGFIAFSASNSVVLLEAMGMRGGGAKALGLIIPSLIALPLVLMKNARSQQPLAILSNTLVMTAVLLMFIDFPYTPSEPVKLWPNSPTEFFVALSISVYAFTGIGSAIPVERVMAPQRYRRLLRLSVAIAYTLLLAFGLSGFLSYGSHTCSVMTVSLQSGPLRTAVSALLFFASLMIIPQQTFPLCELSDRRLLGITRLTTYWDLKPNLLRIFYLAFSAFAAFIVPYYGLLLSISGALGCGIVGLVVPAALDYVRRSRRGLHKGHTMRFWEYLVVFGLGFYGCVVVVIGVVSGSYQLWISIQTVSTSSC